MHSLPGQGCQLAARSGKRLGHENAVVTAFLNGQPFKDIVLGLPHENAQVVAANNRIMNHIVVEIQVQRNALRKIIVQIDATYIAVFREISSHSVKFSGCQAHS